MLVLIGSIASVSPMQANVHSSRTCRLLGFISRKRDVLRHLTRLSSGFEERSTCRTLSASPSTCLLVRRTEPTRWLNATQASRYWRRSSDVRVQRWAAHAQWWLTGIEGSYARIHFLYDSFCLLHQAPQYLKLRFQVNPPSSSPTNLNEHDVYPETVYDETDI